MISEKTVSFVAIGRVVARALVALAGCTVAFSAHAEMAAGGDMLFGYSLYVDPNNGNNQNDGTSPETAKLTIDAAYACVTSNDTSICLLPGVHASPSGDFSTRNASPAYRIRFIAPYGPGRTTLDGGGERFFTGNEAPFTTVEGCTLCGFISRHQGHPTFLAIAFSNCVFTGDMWHRLKDNAPTFMLCVFEDCRVDVTRTFGTDGESQMLNSSFFYMCDAWNSIFEVAHTNSPKVFAYDSLFENCFIATDNASRLAVADGHSSALGNDPAFVETTVLCSSADSDFGFRAERCLIGINGNDSIPSWGNAEDSVITNAASVSAAIVGNYRPARTNLLFRNVGYNSSAPDMEDENLRPFAVTNSDGTLKVLYHGSNSWWNAAGEYAAFDGDITTFVNPRRINYPTWVGYELTEPRVVTRIRFAAPSDTDYEERLRSCQVQGANEPDFSDAVVLLDIRNVVPERWKTGTPYWIEAPAQTLPAPKAFKYLRFIQTKDAMTMPFVNDDTEGCYYIGNVAELEFYGMDMETYLANYVVPAVTKEANLRLYAKHDDTGALAIISDKSEPSGTGYEYGKSFDGNVRTFYDPKDNTAEGHYLGCELIRPMCVTRVRYCGRLTGANAGYLLRHCRIEGANQADFSDAVPLHFCANAVPDDYDSNRGWIDVATDPAAGVNAFKYLRLFEPGGNHQCGDVTELEFYGMDADGLAAQVLANPQPPTDLSVSRGAFPKVPTVLNWKLPVGISDTTILRAPGLGGPWTAVAHVSATNGWTDSTALAGSISYYKAVADFSYDGKGFSSTNETPVSFRRWRLLERDPDSMTALRTGVSVIYRCNESEYWTGDSVAGSVLLPFDNDLNTKADVGSASPRTCIGVDLGERAHFAYLRHYSSHAVGNSNRLNGLALSGSNSAEWSLDGNFTDLIEPLAWEGQGMWYERESLDKENSYRYLFHHNPKANGWNNNVWELQLYGWTESDLARLAMEVSDLAITYGTTPSATLTWTPNSAYGTYTIERKVVGGEWAVVASGLATSTTTWTDTHVATDGTRYIYRVKTVNGENEAYSLECEAVPYTAGNGVGLHGVWSAPYSSMDVGETVISVETNATVNFVNKELGGETTGFFVRWTGKMIAPFAGTYEFEAVADDTLNLWIDGTPILYRNAKEDAAQKVEIALTQGDHDIVITWFQHDGGNVCRLYWGGAVGRAIIPETQLVPVPPKAVPKGWGGARTFSGTAVASYPGDTKFNGDGSVVDMAFGGADLYDSENGYNFTWMPVAGDFEFMVRVEYLIKALGSTGQKGGVMVRAALDSASPFEACLLKWEGSVAYGSLCLGNKRCTARGNKPVDGKDIISGQGAWKVSVGADGSGWVKLKREGSTFTFSYMEGAGGAWIPIYRLEDEAETYGSTVYVGLAASGASTVAASIPRYTWRFSHIRIRTPKGSAFTLR